MTKTLTSKDIDDGRRISALFSGLSEGSKTIAMVYLSALRDKELSDIKHHGGAEGEKGNGG